MYNAMDYDGKCVTYNRTKTKDRRNDKEKMVVHEWITEKLRVLMFFTGS